MGHELELVCTDNGQHGRLSLAILKKNHRGELEQRTTRQAAASWPSGAKIADPDGEGDMKLGNRIIRNADDVTADHQGRRRFRVRCPVCRRDVPLASRAALWFDRTAAVGVESIDVSKMP